MNTCVFCGNPIQRLISINFIFSYQSVKHPLICSNCQKEFKEIEDKEACSGCFRKQENQDRCQDCLKWEKLNPNLPPKHTAIYCYNEIARQYMNQFKFQGDILLGEIFKEILYKKLKTYSKTHLIVPIPLSTTGKQSRGFNQIELLLQEAGIPYENLLVQIRDSKKQSDKNRRERLQVKQPFQRIPHKYLTIEKPVLIVDDVYTTGRTIFHARELFEKERTSESFSLFR